MIAACSTMPAVVPIPRMSNWVSVGSAYAAVPSTVPRYSRNPPWVKTSEIATTITRTLFDTGAQAGAANRSLLFRMAPNSAANP